MWAGRLIRHDVLKLGMVARLIIALLLPMSLAHAQEPSLVRLEYVVEEVRGCPTRTDFEDAVKARLGRNPFVADSPILAFVLLSENDTSINGKLEMRDAANDLLGERTMTGAACSEVADSLAATLSIAIDSIRPLLSSPSTSPPLVSSRSAPVAQPEQPPPPRAEPEPSTVGEASEPHRRLQLEVLLGGQLAGWRSPKVAAGPALSLGLLWNRLELLLRGTVGLLIGTPELESGDRVDGAISLVDLTACVRFGPILIGPRVAIGAFQLQSVEPRERQLEAGLVAFAGLEVGARITFAERFFVRPSLDLDIALVRTSILIGGETVWTAPPIAAGIEISLGIAFL